jgi:hypothetical protein
MLASREHYYRYYRVLPMKYYPLARGQEVGQRGESGTPPSKHPKNIQYTYNTPFYKEGQHKQGKDPPAFSPAHLVPSVTTLIVQLYFSYSKFQWSTTATIPKEFTPSTICTKPVRKYDFQCYIFIDTGLCESEAYVISGGGNARLSS